MVTSRSPVCEKKQNGDGCNPQRDILKRQAGGCHHHDDVITTTTATSLTESTGRGSAASCEHASTVERRPLPEGRAGKPDGVPVATATGLMCRPPSVPRSGRGRRPTGNGVWTSSGRADATSVL